MGRRAALIVVALLWGCSSDDIGPNPDHGVFNGDMGKNPCPTVTVTPKQANAPVMLVAETADTSSSLGWSATLSQDPDPLKLQVDATGRRATYYAVKPGTYTFRFGCGFDSADVNNPTGMVMS